MWNFCKLKNFLKIIEKIWKIKIKNIKIDRNLKLIEKFINEKMNEMQKFKLCNNDDGNFYL